MAATRKVMLMMMMMPSEEGARNEYRSELLPYRVATFSGLSGGGSVCVQTIRD